MTRRIVELAGEYGRYGYRRITALLRAEGWHVNHKRVERIWRREGLKVPQKQPKRGRLWLNDGSCVCRRPEYRNHVWTYDFVHERKDTWRYLSEEEEMRFLDACPDYFKPIAITALNTGMRKSEILNLRWFDVDFQLGQITLRDTKNGRERYIPMNRTLTKTLEKNKIKAQSEYVFTKKDGSPFKDIRKPFFKAIRKAGVGEFRFQDLRHTFASQLVMNGVDLVTVKELLGHRSIDMTMRYAHLSQDHKKRAVERLDGTRGIPGQKTQIK